MATLQNLFKDVEDKMKKAFSTVQREFSEIRGGWATPAFVEHVTVDYYGAATPLKQLAAVTAPEPHLLVIQPWDASVIHEIEKAIQQAGLGINPVVEGKIVRLPIPLLSGERRSDLTKLVNKLAEEGRINIRNLRRDGNEAVKKLKNDKQATEDEVFKGQEFVQKLTDKYIGQIDSLAKSKEQELHST